MKRPLVIFLIALAALCGSLIALIGTVQARNEALRGYRNPLETDELPFRIPRLGVNAELTQYDSDELRRQLELMRSANITWVRQFFPWDEIEPVPGNYNWEAYDRIVETFREYPELELVAVLTNSPTWAHSRGSTHTAPPDNPAHYASFAHAFAERYGDVIDYYQVWDEPNLTSAWGGLPPRPAEYLALLSEGYRAIHQGDPGGNTQVIVAALAPTMETGPENISDILYLSDLYALGAAPYMDAAAGKPFGFNYPPDDRRVEPELLNFSRLIALREIMERAGDGTTPLWASAWGWNALPEDWDGMPSIWGDVSAEQRTNYTLAALDRIEREWAWLGGAALYTWQPDAPLTDPRWGFALVDAENNPTNLYTALASRPAQTAATNGLYFATNPFTTYSGLWQFSELGADIGWVEDSQVMFDFYGSEVGLLLREGDYVALLYPTIDGGQANALPADAAGNSFIQLTSDTLTPELSLVTVASGIANTEHTLRIIADRGWDRWAIAGFAVSSGSLAEAYNRQIAVALFATAAAAVSLIIAARQIRWRSLISPVNRLWNGANEAVQLAITALTSIALLVGMLLTWGSGTPEFFRREPVQIGLALATGGLIYISPSMVITVVAAVLLFVIIYNRLALGALLCIVYAPFFLFPVELYRFAFPMSELMILLTAAVWLLRTLEQWGHDRQTASSEFPPQSLSQRIAKLTAIDWCVGAWVVLGTMAVTWSSIRGAALTDWRTIVIEPVVFYLIVRSSRFNQRDVMLLIDGLLFAAVLVCAVGLYQYLRGDAIIAEGGARRLFSVYGSPNNAALYLERALPFAAAFLIYPLNRARRALSGVIAGVILVTIVLTQSAGALFLGIPISIGLVIVTRWGRRGFALIAAAAFVLTALLFVLANTSERFARLFTGEGTSFFRIRLWQSAAQMIADHPITGLGLDQFLYAYRGSYILPDAWQEPNLSHPHNVIFDFWLRFGIFGVMLLVALQAAFWRAAVRLYRKVKSSFALPTAVIVGAMGAMAGILAHGLVDNSVFVNDLVIVFMFILSLPTLLSNISSIDVEA